LGLASDIEPAVPAQIVAQIRQPLVARAEKQREGRAHLDVVLNVGIGIIQPPRRSRKPGMSSERKTLLACRPVASGGHRPGSQTQQEVRPAQEKQTAKEVKVC
jgi:hypothetical protein